MVLAPQGVQSSITMEILTLGIVARSNSHAHARHAHNMLVHMLIPNNSTIHSGGGEGGGKMQELFIKRYTPQK